MSSSPTRCSIFVLINRARQEEVLVVDGVRGHAEAHQLDWDVIPLDPDRPWSKSLLARALPRGAFIGRQRPDDTGVTRAYPWVAWGHDAPRGEAASPAGDAVVRFDAAAIGRVAVDHLVRAGARSLAIVRRNAPAERSDQYNRINRIEAFRGRAEAAGHAVHVLRDRSCRQISDYFRRLLELRSALERPIGVFCYHDDEASSLIDDALHVGIDIPRDMMILGGNGSAAAGTARVPLSSVRLPYRALGRAAALLSHQLLSGTRPEPDEVVLAPVVVDGRATTAAERRSDDPLIKLALQRIARAKRPLPSVGELAEHCGCRRQLLFARFRRELGCSPQQWLEERAMQRSAQLLADTDLDVKAIAGLCGFMHRTNLSKQFKKRFGVSPSAFRDLER